MAERSGRLSRSGRDRRTRRGEEAEPEPVPQLWGPGAWRSLIALAAVLVAVVASGLLVGRALEPSPSAGLGACHPARQIGPRTYLALPALCIDAHRNYTAEILTSRGRITILLEPESDPQTVNNFVVLASSGFYDGLSFWHVDSWSALGGDPTGTGHGGPGYWLPDEASTGPWNSGVVGMARGPGPHVNGSQFFMLKDQWPGGGPPAGAAYNRLGTVKAGIDVLGTLTAGDRIVSISVTPAGHRAGGS